jgi:hypothetical protein
MVPLLTDEPASLLPLLPPQLKATAIKMTANDNINPISVILKAEMDGQNRLDMA